MSEDYKNIFSELLLSSPSECINIQLSPLEKIMALIIPFKGSSYLTDTQKIMIMKSIKLIALHELDNSFINSDNSIEKNCSYGK